MPGIISFFAPPVKETTSFGAPSAFAPPPLPSLGNLITSGGDHMWREKEELKALCCGRLALELLSSMPRKMRMATELVSFLRSSKFHDTTVTAIPPSIPPSIIISAAESRALRRRSNSKNFNSSDSSSSDHIMAHSIPLSPIVVDEIQRYLEKSFSTCLSRCVTLLKIWEGGGGGCFFTPL